MAMRNALSVLALFLAYGCGEGFDDASEVEPTESMSVEEANEKTSSGFPVLQAVYGVAGP